MSILSSQLAVANVPVAIYTSVNSTCNTVVYFCNTSSATVKVDVYVGPNTTVAPATPAPPVAGQIYKQLSINSTDTYIMSTERLMLDNNDKIWVSCSAANALTITVSYIEV
jgi:hypothetical protein